MPFVFLTDLSYFSLFLRDSIQDIFSISGANRRIIDPPAEKIIHPGSIEIISDKNSLFDRGSTGEMGLCVKKNKSQYMGVLGYPVARGIVRDGRAGKAGLRDG